MSRFFQAVSAEEKPRREGRGGGGLEIEEAHLSRWGLADGTISFPETETTAYFLLTHLSMAKVSTEKTSQIVCALIQRQNPYGGLSSTQVTVVGMQALAKYATLIYRPIEDLKMVVKSGESFQHELMVLGPLVTELFLEYFVG